jgi:hypothetical protein
MTSRHEGGSTANRHDLGAVPSPTRADFFARLEAIGLGRWASLYTGACEREQGAAVEERRRS